MGKLNQVIAVAGGKKTQATKAITEVYHKLQKEALLTGISRVYKPKDEDGDRLPPESKQVQFRVEEALAEAVMSLSDMWDVIATQEHGNTFANADVLVNGATVLEKVPVTTLLFLEKQLVDVRTLIEKLPTLDPGEEWTFSQAGNCYATKPSETTRTKKIPKSQVLYEATDRHPAQVQAYAEDVIVGYWTTTNFSGAIPASEKSAMLARVRSLQEAVKVARESANSVDVPSLQIAESVFKFLFPSK